MNDEEPVGTLHPELEPRNDGEFEGDAVPLDDAALDDFADLDVPPTDPAGSADLPNDNPNFDPLFDREVLANLHEVMRFDDGEIRQWLDRMRSDHLLIVCSDDSTALLQVASSLYRHLTSGPEAIDRLRVYLQDRDAMVPDIDQVVRYMDGPRGCSIIVQTDPELSQLVSRSTLSEVGLARLRSSLGRDGNYLICLLNKSAAQASVSPTVWQSIRSALTEPVDLLEARLRRLPDEARQLLQKHRTAWSEYAAELSAELDQIARDANQAFLLDRLVEQIAGPSDHRPAFLREQAAKSPDVMLRDASSKHPILGPFVAWCFSRFSYLSTH